MRKTVILTIAVVAFMAFALSETAYAKRCSFGGSKSADKGGIVNTVCPVMGAKVDKDTSFSAVHKGKKIGFCCAGCVDKFNKNPKKYMSKIKKTHKCEINCPKCGAEINVKKECKKQCKKQCGLE